MFQCMMGGAWFDELFGHPDSAKSAMFEDVAIRSVAQQMKVKVDPSKVKVTIQKVGYLSKERQPFYNQSD